MPLASTFASGSGEGYEVQMGRWSRRLAPKFVAFSRVNGGKSVLDVGCGTGSLSFCLAANPDIASVVGLDLSPAYVEHARQSSSDPRVSFQLGDARDLPFSDGSFDHSLSMLALQFVPGPELAIREMCRVTHSGGTVAAATWDTRGGFVAYRMIVDAAAMLHDEGSELRARSYTRPMSRPGGLARGWSEAGLRDVVEDMLTIRMEYTCFEDFWAPVEGEEGPIAEYVRTLDVDAKARLLSAVRSAYLDGESDGLRSYAATAWVVRGIVP
jgi:SAM-dependent methyltransferase